MYYFDTVCGLRAFRTLKTVVNPFVTSCVSDAQNCGEQIFKLAERPFCHIVRCRKIKTVVNANLSLRAATLSSFRACWMLKTVVECKSFTSPSNPFVTSCALDAQNCRIKWACMDFFDPTGPDYGGLCSRE